MPKNGLRIFVLAMLGTRVERSFLTGKLHHPGGIIYFLIALAAHLVSYLDRSLWRPESTSHGGNTSWRKHIIDNGDRLRRRIDVRPLREAALSGKFQRFQGCAPRPGRVAIGHHMNRNVRLFLALIRHARADLSQKPLLEFRAGFEDTTSHDQSIGVESIYHFIEKQSQRVSLNPKNLFAQGIALVRQPANELGRLMSILFCQGMTRIALQENMGGVFSQSR